MGNATDDVKQRATHVTASNEDEGFAKAIDMILTNSGAALIISNYFCASMFFRSPPSTNTTGVPFLVLLASRPRPSSLAERSHGIRSC